MTESNCFYKVLIDLFNKNVGKILNLTVMTMP